MRKEIWSQPLEAWILRFCELLCQFVHVQNKGIRLQNYWWGLLQSTWELLRTINDTDVPLWETGTMLSMLMDWKNLSSLQTSGRSKSGTMSQQRQESPALLHRISLLWHSNAFSRSSVGQNPGRNVTPENNEPAGHLLWAQTLKPVWESELNEHQWLRRKLNLFYNWDSQNISKGGPKTAHQKQVLMPSTKPWP